MTLMTPSRRKLLGAAATLGVVALLPRRSRAALPDMHVLKDPNCGCCTGWVQIMRDEGFSVTTEETDNAALARVKQASGIPESMISCHTARIDRYVIEGHVPPADIRRLLDTHPEAVGLAVPGMPFGSPGMGPESEREAFDVHLIRADGSSELFTRYPAA